MNQVKLNIDQFTWLMTQKPSKRNDLWRHLSTNQYVLTWDAEKHEFVLERKNN